MKRLIICISFIICHLSFSSVAAQSGYGTGGGFNPENPDIPGANGLYLDKGLVVIDGLRSGSYDDIGDNIYAMWQRYCDEQGYGEYSNERDSEHMLEVFDRIHTVIVCADFSLNSETHGMIGISEDIGMHFRKMTTLDLSRTSGWTIDYSLADGEYLQNLEVLVLPDCVEEVVSMADLPNLTDVYCYADLPPTQRQYSEWYTQPLFAEHSEVKVYVPTSSVDLYKASDTWGKYNIIDAETNVGKIEVKMPQGVDVAQYRNMWLTLTDETTQLMTRYIVTDRNGYFFAGVNGNDGITYTAALVNRFGTVVCQEAGIKPGKGTTVAQLKNPKPVTIVTANVWTDNQNVTDMLTLTWYDAQGERITSSPSLAGVVGGDVIDCDVKLPSSMLQTYAQPERKKVTIPADVGPTYKFNLPSLQPRKKHTVVGFVRDADTHLPLHEMTVTAIQNVAEGVTNTYNSLSYGDGRFIVQCFEGPLTISISSKEYLRRDLQFDIYSSTPDEFLVGDYYLRRADGKTITLDFSHTMAGVDEPGYTYSFCRDYQDVLVSVYNESQGGVLLRNVSVQLPQVVVLDGADDGDELRLELSSASGAFDTFSLRATIEDGAATVQANIIEKGGFRSSFTTTQNGSVAAIVYDSEGQFVDYYVHKKATLDVKGLSEGDYTLITMAYDPVVNRLSTLQSFQDMGLQRDVDYLQRDFHVSPGILTVIEQGEVPVINVDDLKVLHASTTFSISQPTVILGSYATVRARVKVKNDIAQDSWHYDNFRIILDIPSDCTYLKGSLLVDGDKVDPEYEDGRLMIRTEGLEEGKLIDVRYCIVGKTEGQKLTSALLGYRYIDWQNGDKDYYCPVGSATFTVSPMQYTIVTETTGDLIAGGKGPRDAVVSAYVDDALFSQTTIAGDSWGFEQPLPQSYNLASHAVRIECETKEGNVYSTPVTYVTINADANRVKRVTMLYPNAYANKTYTCNWEFLKNDDVVQSYDYYPSSTSFTFLVEFLKNDTTQVGNVRLKVKMHGGKKVKLPAVFDSERGCWVATLNSPDHMPVNVSLNYDLKNLPTRVDRQHIDNIRKDMADLISEQNELARILNEISEENIDQKMAEFEAIIGTTLLDVTLDADTRQRIDAMTPQELEEEADRLIAESEEQLAEIADLIDNMKKSADLSPFGTHTLDDGSVLTVTDCSAYSESSMEALGFDRMEMTDGSVVYILEQKDYCEMVDFKSGIAMKMTLAQTPDGRHRNIAQVIDAACQYIDSLINDAKTKLDMFLAKIAEWVRDCIAMKEVFTNRIAVNTYLLNNTELSWTKKLMLRAQIVKDKIGLLCNMKTLKFATKLPGIISKIIPIASYIAIFADFKSSGLKWIALYNSIPWPCPKMPDEALTLRNMCEDGAVELAGFFTFKLGTQIACDIAAAGSAAAAAPTGGTSLLVGLGIYLAKQAISFGIDYAYNQREASQMAMIRTAKSGLECEEEDKPDDEEGEEEGGGEEPTTPDKVPLIDPSGFVCEAVESNRLEGVTATCFYKKEVEDMYGDKHEEVTVWEAENYGQVNPQLTDRDGMYSWMVPAGQWQVLYEKDGYETKRSEWLPVPPPQLDVNVDLVRRAQPALSTGQAYEKAIDVDFSLYMKSNYITKQTLTFWQDGQQLQGELKATNGEAAFSAGNSSIGGVSEEESEGPQYATSFRFVPKKALAVGSEVTVRVNGIVRSYADVPIGEDQELKLTVGREVTSIGSDGNITVPYGGTHQVVISAKSAQAAAYRKVTITSLSPDIAQLETDRVTLDAEGKAYITVKGLLPGTTYLNFAVEGSQVKGMDTVRVVSDLDFVEAPKASIISGMYVSEGTQVELTAQPGCTIWYTLDGSCPCDETTRKRYTGPITINTNTKLRAMAVDAKGNESEVVTFTWFIGTGIANVNVNANNNIIYDLQGRKTEQSGRGIYIINGKKVLQE